MAPVKMEDLTPGMALTGKVKQIEVYGAFVDIGVGKDALLHVSQLGQAKVRSVEDVVKVDQEITVYVLKVDAEAGRVALSLMKPPTVSWDDINEGDMLEGEVVRVENFGAFVDIGAERPGMVHVSELADGFVRSPGDVVSVGDKVKARVIKINRKKRQIDLSLKEPEVAYDPGEDEVEELPTAMAVALRRAMEDSGDELPDSGRGRRRGKKRRTHDEQDDILSRTLRNQSN